jgi:hypothetical protein
VANKTMLGMSPLAQAPAPAPVPSSAPSSAPAPEPAPVSAARVVSISGAGNVGTSKPVPGTMMGVRIDGLPEALKAQGAAAPAGHRTMLGVALPGIAPTHDRPPPAASPPQFVPPPPPPSVQSQQSQQAHGAMQAAPPQLQATGVLAPVSQGEVRSGDDFVDEDERRRRAARARPRSPMPAIFVAAFAAIVLIVVVLLWVRAKPPPRLVVERHEGATADDLVVKCDACGDDGDIEANGEHAHFSNGEAKLSLAHDKLVPGKNTVATTLTVGKRSWPIALEIVVPYLARVSLDRLGTDGTMELVLDVAPQVESVKVDDATTAAKGGKVVLPIPIAPTKDDASKTFTRTIGFTVSSKGSDPREGSIAVSIPWATSKLAVAHVGAGKTPTIFAIGGTAKISGKSQGNAHVVIGDAKADADASGKLSVDVPVADDANAITIVVFASGSAPRAIDLSVLHARSIDDAWKQIRSMFGKSTQSQQLADPDAHVGEWIDATVAVHDTKEEDGRVVVAGDVRCASGDASCPTVRVLLPAGITAAKDDVVRAGGVITRGIALDKSKSKATEIEAIVAAPSK